MQQTLQSACEALRAGQKPDPSLIAQVLTKMTEMQSALEQREAEGEENKDVTPTEPKFESPSNLDAQHAEGAKREEPPTEVKEETLQEMAVDAGGDSTAKSKGEDRFRSRFRSRSVDKKTEEEYPMAKKIRLSGLDATASSTQQLQ